MKISYVVAAILLLITALACSKKSLHVKQAATHPITKYEIKDSVFFDLISSDTPPHQGLKEYTITIEKSNDTLYRAHYSCSIEYFLDCACQVEDDSKPSPFSIEYKVYHNIQFSNNDNIEIVSVEQAKQKLVKLYEKNKLEESCTSLKKNAKKYIGNPKSLENKFKYMLSHIHRYDKSKFAASKKSLNKSRHLSIDAQNVTPFSNISDAVFINDSKKKELNIWKTNQVVDHHIELEILNLSQHNTEKSIEDIGNNFLNKQLKFESIHDMLFEYQSYELDEISSALKMYTLKLRTENGHIKHHMYRSITAI